jgi:hypothetical protein
VRFDVRKYAPHVGRKAGRIDRGRGAIPAPPRGGATAYIRMGCCLIYLFDFIVFSVSKVFWSLFQNVAFCRLFGRLPPTSLKISANCPPAVNAALFGGAYRR